MKKIAKVLFCTVVATLIVFAAYGAGAAESAADFYKNNTVTMVITYGPGGGTDAAGRIIADQWSKVTGGKMVVRNMTGAGGLRAMNHIYGLKADGLTLGYTDSASSLLGPVVFETPGIEFEANKFVYLAANAVTPNGIGISPRLKADSIEDMQKISGLKFGAHAIDSQAARCALTIELFKLKDARIVTGFGGMEEEGLALARGEIDAYSNSMHSLTNHIEKNFVKKVVLVYAIKRSPYFPDTPLPTELVKLTPRQQNMYNMVAFVNSVKPILAPPGLAKDKADYLKTAFEKLFQSEGYLEKMKVRFPVMGPDFHMTADEWTQTVKEAVAIPKEEKADFIKLVKSYTR